MLRKVMLINSFGERGVKRGKRENTWRMEKKAARDKRGDRVIVC